MTSWEGLLVCLAVISAADAQLSGGTVLEVLTRTTGLKIFGGWCREAMEDYYSGTNQITVFAFNDSAYNTMPAKDKMALQTATSTVLLKKKYVGTFTLNSIVKIEQLYDRSVVKSMNGVDLFINKRTKQYWNPGSTTGTTATYINGAMIVRDQIQCSNGVIHVLDRVPAMPSKENTYNWINTPDDSSIQTTLFREMMDKLVRDYYNVALSPVTDEKITMFMPSNDALRQIPSQKLTMLNGLELSNRIFFAVTLSIRSQYVLTIFLTWGELGGRSTNVLWCDGTINQYFRMHYIPGKVVFTSYVDNQESYDSGKPGSRILFLRHEDKVMVKSGGVTAMVVRGNITVENGVIHIVDRMFGYVYNSAKEQVSKDCPRFSRLIDQVSPELQSMITQPSNVNLFVPTDQAFEQIDRLTWVNFNTDARLRDFVMKLSMVKQGDIQVASQTGNYESRRRVESRYNSWKLIIYNDRNNTWVNGGHVRAIISRPDVKVTTGTLQYIEAVLGIPYMDIPTLIEYDDYLIFTYNDMRMTGLDVYMKDPRYTQEMKPPNKPNRQGNTNMQYPGNMNMAYTTRFPNQFPTQFPNQVTQYPNNVPKSQVDAYLQQTGQQNRYPSNQQYPTTRYPGQQQQQYPGQQNQYPGQQNQYPGQQQQYPTSSGNFGTCGDYNNVCQFTFFVPNGTAVFNYYNTNVGQRIVKDINRYRYILRRLIIPNTVLYLEQIPVSPQTYVYDTHSGEKISLKKETDNIVRLSWAGQSARVIMWDLGATNGVVHIIDNILSDMSDIDRDISRASGLLSQNFVFISFIALLLSAILAV